MKSTIPLLFLLTACALSGCTTAGQAYARQHPDLPPAQLQILKTGRVPDGTAIAGMTQEQVKLAMGGDATQYTKIDGHDAWIYVQKRLSSTGITAGTSGLDRPDKRNHDGSGDTDNHAYQSQPESKTTIYFDGDLATHADVINGGL